MNKNEASENRDLSLNRAIRLHWEKFLPKMYADLVASGELDERVDEAATMTAEALSKAVGSGQQFHQAWEAIANEWAFLPAESDEESETDQ